MNVYSNEEFLKDAKSFVEKSNQINDDWELVCYKNDTSSSQYLQKKQLLSINSSDFDTKSEQTTCYHHEVHTEADPACCDLNSSKLQSILRFEYHTAYSESYGAPVLYFNIYRDDGSLLRIEEVWKLFKSNYIYDDRYLDMYKVITQMEHPILFKVFYAIHPCQTQELLSQNFSSKNKIVTFLSTMGPLVMLKLDPGLKMFCQYCLSSESDTASLVGMQSKFFEQNGLQISYLDCYRQCKQIKIEDEQSAKICLSCIPVLTEEYTLMQLKSDQSNCAGPLDVSIASIKKELKLNVKFPTTITLPAATIQENKIKTESVETVSTTYQIVLFPVSEIKEEAELQIGVEAEPSLNIINSSVTENTVDSSASQYRRKKHDSIGKGSFCEKKFQPKHKFKGFRIVNKKTKHIVNRFTNADKIHQCLQCEKIYDSPPKLNRHLTSSHITSRDHKCNQCSADFKTKIYLQMHVKNVHPLVKFQCFYCSKIFNNKSHLIQHLFSHSKYKNFKCTKCESAFTSKKTMAAHLRIVHSLEKYECHHCCYWVKCKSNMLQHLRYNHFGGKYIKKYSKFSMNFSYL